MSMPEHSSLGRIGWLAAATAATLAAGGCDARPSAPETRAEYFVRKMVREPQALEDLRAVALLPESGRPDELIADLPAHTAVTYLRARARLGAELGFHVAGTLQPAVDERRVDVVVSEGLGLGATPTVRFSVELRRVGGDWRVARLRAD